MTMSPTSQPKTGMTGGKKMTNPQYTSSKFERTYQSLSSQKKIKASGSDSGNSNNNTTNRSKKRSPYRYTDD